MNIIRNNTDSYVTQTAVVIGNFDGVHAGHQQMIQHLLAYADANNLQPILITFLPHPKCFFANCDNYLLMNETVKSAEVEKCGIKTVHYIDFTKEFASLSPQDFLDILLGSFNASYVLVGQDFRFGYQGRGDVDFLRAKSKEIGFKLDVFADFCIDNQRVSSTLVRDELFAGNMQMVNKLLARDFSYSGKVIKGRQLGRTIGVPTANVFIGSKFAMPNGVFLVRVEHESQQEMKQGTQQKSQFNGKSYFGICNIGRKPTLHGDTRLLEVHIFDFNESIYEQQITVYPLQKLRDEIKFDSIDDLSAQIQKDIILARSLISD